MYSGLTNAQVEALANNYTKIAVLNFGILLEEIGVSLDEIGFTVFGDSME